MVCKKCECIITNRKMEFCPNCGEYLKHQEAEDLSYEFEEFNRILSNQEENDLSEKGLLKNKKMKLLLFLSAICIISIISIIGFIGIKNHI